MIKNLDENTINGFGEEWKYFDQAILPLEERRQQFERYFKIFPWKLLSKDSKGFDLGCGSGRWAQEVSKKVGHLHCIDASKMALEVAKKNLSNVNNCSFHLSSVDSIPIPDESMDFGYSLGVLHHIPDTFAGIKSCVSKLKKGSPFLVYLYYAFDNKPSWYPVIWKISDNIRKIISSLPFKLRCSLTQLIAFFIYLPLATIAKLSEKSGLNVENFPLSAYRNHSFYTMKTDALDRFGTKLEQRFTKNQISKMMLNAGLIDIKFSDEGPFWCAVGIKGSN